MKDNVEREAWARYLSELTSSRIYHESADLQAARENGGALRKGWKLRGGDSDETNKARK